MPPELKVSFVLGFPPHIACVIGCCDLYCREIDSFDKLATGKDQRLDEEHGLTDWRQSRHRESFKSRCRLAMCRLCSRITAGPMMSLCSISSLSGKLDGQRGGSS